MIDKRAKQLHRDYAVDFLHSYSFIACIGFMASSLAIGTLLYRDGGQQTLVWSVSFSALQVMSFFLRYFNEEIFKSIERRERFGQLMNLVDGLAFCACLLYLPFVSVTTAVFMSLIILLMCSGASMTSAGYQPLLWSFCAPVLAIQVITFSIMFLKTGVSFYGILVFIVIFCTYLVHGSATNIRQRLYSVISARIEAERANRSKTRFFAASTHDLRQPLAALAALLTTITKKNDNESLRPLLRNAIEAANMIDKQISPMMELARIDSGQLTVNKQKFDLVTCLTKLVLLCEERLNDDVAINFHCTLESASYYSDQTLIKRVVNNIVDNSIKYTETGTIDVMLTSHFSDYRLVIRDTGIGIDKDKLDIIFDEFYQVDNPYKDPTKGFGLGLPIVSRICEKLDITFTMTSGFGVYTEVVLLLPKRAAFIM